MKNSPTISATSRIEEIDQLYASVKRFHDAENVEKILDFIVRFPRLSPFNALLIYIQKPGSTYVATARFWKEKFGRVPKAEATPLVIMKPFGPVSFVFELSDTEGDDVPDQILHPFQTAGEIGAWRFNRFLFYLQKEGIQVKKGHYGSDFAGKIQRQQLPKTLTFTSPRGKIRRIVSSFEVVVNENMNRNEVASTIFHELGHYFCGHFAMPRTIKHIPQRNLPLAQTIEEFEAETVCWLVCKRLGMRPPSAEYLRPYLDKNGDTPEGISFDAILKACGKIEAILDGSYKTPEELIVR